MTRAVVERLISLSHDPNNEVKAAAAYALGESGGAVRSVIERLLQMTHDPDLSVKLSATKALGRLFRPSSIKK